MKKVKITVLKTTLDKELAKEYGAEGLTECPMICLLYTSKGGACGQPYRIWLPNAK